MAQINRILSIETSCDDTSVAVVSSPGFVEICCSANQDLAHLPFGGVVPEIASRQHSEVILPLIDTALDRAQITWDMIDGIAVTNRPGLHGSLLVGLVTAKGLSLAKKIPFLGVNHIEGHILAPLLADEKITPHAEFGFPYLALVVSGGHTHLFVVRGIGDYQLIGQTIDDAAGEAFDKFAKTLGLGYPGGVQIDQWAQRGGNPKAFSFPRSMIREDGYQMSFSGLKSSGQRTVEALGEEKVQQELPHLAASFQEAIVDVLLSKIERAMVEFRLRNLTITGGVSANSRLRFGAEKLASLNHWILQLPAMRYCTDNAAMVGYAGLKRMQRGEESKAELAPSPQSLPGDFK